MFLTGLYVNHYVLVDNVAAKAIAVKRGCGLVRSPFPQQGPKAYSIYLVWCKENAVKTWETWSMNK